jgi:acetylornithine deacetylase/succinyl-diaminopimelate desuccinylase-like protein
MDQNSRRHGGLVPAALLAVWCVIMSAPALSAQAPSGAGRDYRSLARDISGLFIERGDGRAHGKDERVRASDFYAGVEFYDQFMKALVGR